MSKSSIFHSDPEILGGAVVFRGTSVCPSASLTCWLAIRQMNWLGLSNGRLLAVANSQFEVFVTVDKNLVRQQDLTGLRIAVIVLRARSNKIDDLGPLVPQV